MPTSSSISSTSFVLPPLLRPRSRVSSADSLFHSLESSGWKHLFGSVHRSSHGRFPRVQVYDLARVLHSLAETCSSKLLSFFLSLSPLLCSSRAYLFPSLAVRPLRSRSSRPVGSLRENRMGSAITNRGQEDRVGGTRDGQASDHRRSARRVYLRESSPSKRPLSLFVNYPLISSILSSPLQAVMLELAEIQGGWELADGKKVVDIETGEQVSAVGSNP